ncbi:MAG: LysR family transcriptional regulator [Betaproteobacteria bacterium]|nr:LysR family transcriptional regulator [Betaproteobacteria bacterium]MDA8533425.1 LysR family transcriptional regulator [Burkholderiaceae bacterium]MDA9885206.1 LysR family transcriptional regulator [Burkholderiaceae bacterium]
MPIRFKQLDLNLLRVFDEVMAERNLTRAADNLAMTQPAVSNAIRRLREALQDDLVRRQGFGVEPTARALALWPSVRAALSQLRESIAPEGFDHTQAQDTFILAMSDATAADLMPPLVSTLDAVAPGVSMRVLPLTTRDPRTLLEKGDVDIAVGHFPGVMAELDAVHLHEASPSFLHSRLYSGRYVVVMRRDHPLAKKKQLALDEFCAARHLLVSFSGRPFGFVDEALRMRGKQRRVVMTVNQFFTAGRVVVSSDLLTVLPADFVNTTGMAHAMTIRELPLQVPDIHVDALWHRHAEQRPAHQWLLETIQRCAALATSTEEPLT